MIKAKSIIINGDLHYKFKTLCRGKNMKIGAVIEDLIALYVKNQKSIQGLIDKEKENGGLSFREDITQNKVK
jgi:predicted lactoylglutathione lyase